jgi:hypothetical protein
MNKTSLLLNITEKRVPSEGLQKLIFEGFPNDRVSAKLCIWVLSPISGTFQKKVENINYAC